MFKLKLSFLTAANSPYFLNITIHSILRNLSRVRNKTLLFHSKRRNLRPQPTKQTTGDNLTMIANLFSIFDPASTINMSLNWSSILIGLAILPPSFFLFNSRVLSAWGALIKYLNKEVSILLPTKVHHFIVIFLALFMFIIFNNSLGLFPHIFTASSHLVFTISLALPIWLGYYIYGWVNKFKGIIAHLVPSGTPATLIPFIVIIETVRSLIRPLTLAVRLAANIIAGHLLIVLLRNYATIFAPTIVIVVTGSQILLLILETAVAVIQAYVFIVLSVLYVREI